MSTSFPPTGTPLLHNVTSPENIRSIFYTNLILLGVYEYSSAYSDKHKNQYLVDNTVAHNGFKESLRETSCSLESPPPMTRPVSQQPLQQQYNQTIIIDSYGYDTRGHTKPLELHRHIFAKGHQSTKALEFILWFLFTRLDMSQTRDRFKECWPVIDRYDAREFRNVAFKWLEELRKDGCFGVGHQLAKDESLAVSVNNRHNSNTSSHASGLGLFLPTIRRSYLDESIGERIEQLVLVLSTFVLSTVIKKEYNFLKEDDLTLWKLISRTPECNQDEVNMLDTIDSQIVQRSQSFLQSVEHQKTLRMNWNRKSQEICNRLASTSRELTDIESERRMFLIHQTHIVDRTGELSLDELRVLENRWIEKINDQWRPILSYIERHVERKDILQALLDADSGSGSSVLDGKKLQTDLTMTVEHLMSHSTHNSSHIDIVSILKAWKQSLLYLENESKQNGNISESSVIFFQSSMERLSKSHARQLEVIKGTRARLEDRLNEVTQRVNRLKREKKILNRPYRRLFSGITMPEGHGNEISGSPSLSSLEDIRKEATIISTAISSALASACSNNDSPSSHQAYIRNQIRESASQPLDNQHNSHHSLLHSYRNQNISEVLLVRAPHVVVPYSVQHLDQASRADTLKLPRHSIKSDIAGADTYLPSTNIPNTARSDDISTNKGTAASSQLSEAISGSNLRSSTSTLFSKNGSEGTKALMESLRKISLAKNTSIKPLPEDLVVRGSIKHAKPYEAVCNVDSTVAATPSTSSSSAQSNRRPHQSNMKPQLNAATQSHSISPTSKRTALWTSLFQNRDLRNRINGVNAKSHVADKPSKTTSPINHISTPNIQTITDMLPAASLPIQQKQESPHSPLTTPPSRSLFRERLGASRKRSQSSDFQPGRSTTPSHPVPAELQNSSIWNKGNGRSSLTDIFSQESDDEPPGTPSKRRKVDSVVGQHTSYIFDKEVPANGGQIYQPAGPITKTPDRPPSLKALRSPKMTLDDLRAPTPKSIKTKEGEKTGMPLMLLHTPQQKLLFQMEAGLIPKVSNPFTKLTPSSIIDVKGKSTSISPTGSPLKRPAFSSSIFARFKSSSGYGEQKNTSQLDHPTQTPNRTNLWDASSPFAPSPTPVKIRHSLQSVAPTLTKSVDKRPVTTTSIMKHLLNGDSVDLGKTRNEKENIAIGEANASRTTIEATSPVRTSPKLSTKVQPNVQPQYQEQNQSVSTFSSTARTAEAKSAALPNSNILSSAIGIETAQLQTMGIRDFNGEEESIEDPDNNDTRGFSPPPVSPIRGSDPEIFKSFAESMMHVPMTTRQSQNERPLSSSQLFIPNRSIARQHTTTITVPDQDQPSRPDMNVIETLVAESLNSEEEAERQRFLDEPMSEFDENSDDDADRRETTRHRETKEDETVINIELQSIFGKSRNGGYQSIFRNSRSKSISQAKGSNSGVDSVYYDKMRHADVFGSSEHLSHDTEEHVFKNVMEDEGSENESMHVGGLFDEMMPEGLDPNEILWENTEMFS
ncbi:hypothetical protein FBU30_008886 [Linnemannia zychae]|nr:hypothetical protein FBU30_008886 [Linnemannia zychae]